MISSDGSSAFACSDAWNQFPSYREDARLGNRASYVKKSHSSSDEDPSSERTARQHIENVVTHDPKRNLLAFQQVCDQPWSNHQQRPPIGQRQKAWVERRLKILRREPSPSRGSPMIRDLGLQSAYLPGRTQTTAILTTPGLMSSDCTDISQLSLTIASYITSSSLASGSTPFLAKLSGTTGNSAIRGTFSHDFPPLPFR